MKNIVGKFKDKEWIQEKLVEIIGNGLMICIGLIGAYFIKFYIIQ